MRFCRAFSKSTSILTFTTLLFLASTGFNSPTANAASIEVSNQSSCEAIGGRWNLFGNDQNTCRIIDDYVIELGDVLSTTVRLLFNEDTIENYGTVIYRPGSSGFSNGTFYNYGEVVIDRASFQIFSVFLNHGTLSNSGGEITTSGFFNNYGTVDNLGSWSNNSVMNLNGGIFNNISSLGNSWNINRCLGEFNNQGFFSGNQAVESCPPTAILHVNPNPAGAGEMISFDARDSFSSDPNEQLQFLWELNGAGRHHPGQPFIQFFTRPNEFNVSVLAVNSRGQMDIASKIMTVLDDDFEPPNFDNFIPPEPVFTTEAYGAFVLFPQPVASDNREGCCDVHQLSQLGPGSLFPVGSTTVSYIAEDFSGNTTRLDFEVVVILLDIIPPVITVPATIQVDAFSFDAVPVEYSVGVTDNTDPAPQLSCTPSSGSLFSIGNTTVVCTANDESGNESQASFVVEVSFVDSDPPTLTVPQSVLVEVTALGAVTVDYSSEVIVEDEFDPAPSLTCSPASGSLFPIGSTAVNCTATDNFNNSSQASFDVVVELIDVTPPTITVPADIHIEILNLNPVAVDYEVSAADDFDPVPDLSCSPASGSLFAVGVSRVDCEALDAAGNQSAAGFNVTIEFIATIPFLVDTVSQLDLSNGQANSLLSKLDSALDSLQRGNAVTAANQLNAFTNEVQAQTGKAISPADAAWLLELAAAISANL